MAEAGKDGEQKQNNGLTEEHIRNRVAFVDSLLNIRESFSSPVIVELLVKSDRVYFLNAKLPGGLDAAMAHNGEEEIEEGKSVFEMKPAYLG